MIESDCPSCHGEKEVYGVYGDYGVKTKCEFCKGIGKVNYDEIQQIRIFSDGKVNNTQVFGANIYGYPVIKLNNITGITIHPMNANQHLITAILEIINVGIDIQALVKSEKKEEGE